ncbi:MAG TPA: hypothetical protein VHM64_13805 [Candidatus Binatia bacterium]|nr:hypothetical protein [Candidatus Binatia bacterium]
MIRPEFRQTLLDQRGAAVILWSAFTIFIVVYIVIAENVLANPKYARGLWFAETARMIFWALAVVDLGYYVYWKKRYLAPDSIAAGASKTKLLRALDTYNGLHEKQAALVVSTYITRKVVIYAILEALAVYGLVLAIVGRYFMDQYILSALSLILLALEFPTERGLQAVLRTVE